VGTKIYVEANKKIAIGITGRIYFLIVYESFGH
jgi:hypothetical protein